MRRLAVTALVLVAAVGGGCGGDRSGGPKGRPDEIIGAAPDVTLRQRTARVAVETPTARSAGTITFPDRADVSATGRGDSPELADPLEVVDLVRGATDIVPYGGGEVRGASTIRYSFDVDLDVAAAHATTDARRQQLQQARSALGAATFYADVWIDSKGRIRRVQLPVDRHDKRPAYREVVLERLVTVDFYDFNGEGEKR